MSHDDLETLRARLEEQLRRDIEILQEAHRIKLRAVETIRQARAEPMRAASPVPTAPPPPQPPRQTRRGAWSVINELEALLPKLPEEFDKRDVIARLGYTPSKATLARAFDVLRQEGVLAISETGIGRQPSRFRKLAKAAPAEPGDATEPV
jgi:hypothetical protein